MIPKILSLGDSHTINASPAISQKTLKLIYTASVNAVGSITVTGTDIDGDPLTETLTWTATSDRRQLGEKAYARDAPIHITSQGSRLETDPTVTIRQYHRRAQIIDSIAEKLNTLKQSIEDSGFPVEIKTIQKRFPNWTTLKDQNALPALLVTYGDNGAAPDSDVVGYIDEQFPIAITAVMEDDRSAIEVTDLASDIHYSIGRLINSDPTLGVEGVNPERTRISTWRGSEGAISKFEIIRFSVLVVHRYFATEDV